MIRITSSVSCLYKIPISYIRVVHVGVNPLYLIEYIDLGFLRRL